MSNLRKAAQTALEAWDRSRQWPFPTRPDKEFDALRAALAQPEPAAPYPLPDSLYPDSKDWVASDYVGRVEWLHFMYESKKREVEQLEATLSWIASVNAMDYEYQRKAINALKAHGGEHE